MFIEVVMAIALALLSIIDIIRRRIPLLMIGGVILLALISAVVVNPIDWVLMAAGVAVGLGFVLISKVTREKIGYGDSLLFLALGILLGFWEVMMVILIAFLGSACFAILLVCFKKKKKNASFPFVPFIALSYTLVIFVL